MKLHPQQAPLYGQCVLTVQLCSEELVDDGQEVEYFLFFCGSTQRHVTSTLRSDHDTLRALCPAHDCCESVRVVLCSVRPCGVSLSREQVPGVHGSSSLVAPLAEHRFSFVQDLAFDMAQFLVSTAGRSDALEGALLLDECQIPLQECERLDESLSLALKHLALPPGWSLLGSTLKNSTDPVPQETLLHFAARRGLRRVADFLLCQPGAGQALRLANRQGHTPFDIAGFRGHEQLQQLLSQAEQEGETERDGGTETTNQSAHSDVRVVCHLPKLNTYTLTVGPCQGLEPPTLQRCVEHLRHLICHLQAKGVQSLELQSESLHNAAECSDGLETQPACLGRLQQQQLWSLDKLALGKQADTEDVGNSDISGGGRGGNGGNAERDEESPLGPPTQECSPDNGLQSSEDGVCLRANTERDYHQTEEEQRRGEREEQERDPAASVVDDQSLCSDERVHRQPERENPALGALSSHTSSCGKQTGLTDREEGDSGEGEEAAHREGQRGASEGREGAKQDGEEESTAGRREEESSNRGELTTLDSSRTLSDTMGITPSVEFSDLSDSSDSDTKENTEENLGNEEEEETEEECNQKSLSDLSDDGLSLDEETPGSKGLRGPISSSPASSSTPSNGSDVKREVTSESPVMEGLHEGEPPPSLPADTNTSLEQTQETAGGDYSTEEQQQTHCTAADGSSSSALETAHHSGDHTGSEEDTGRADGDIAVVCLQDRQIAVSSVCTESGWPLNEASIEDMRDFETVFDSVDYSETEDLTHCEASSETMPSSGAVHTDTDPGTNPGLSSDEEGSFRSALSSTTELFLPAQEASGPDTNEQESSSRTQPTLENPVPVQKKVVEQTDKELNVCGECCSQSNEMGLHLEQNRDALPEQEDSRDSRDMNCEDAVPISPGSVPNSQLPTGMETVGQCDAVPNELDENSRPSDSWCPLDHSASKLMVIDSGQTFMNSAGSAPVSQASLGQETKGPLIPEVAVEQLISECFIGEPSVEPTLPENKGIQTIPESRYVTEEHNNTDMNVTQEGNRTDMNVENKQGPLGSKVTDWAIVKPDLSLLAEGREEGDISLVEVDTEKSVGSQLASGEESIETNLRSIIQNVREDNSDSTTNERSSALDADGDMGRSDAVNEVSPQVQMSSYAEYVPSQDDGSAPTAAMNRASWESPALENVMGLFPDKLNSAGGDSGCQTRPLEDMDALESGDTPDGRVAEDNVTTIHRDKDTSYPLSLSACPQPHTSQRTGSSGSSVFPSLSLSSSVGSSAHRDSGSDSESLLSAEPGDDNVFRKCDDVVTCVDSTSEVSVSCSSTDDTASVGPPCSSPDSCLEGQTQALGTWTPEESTPTGVNAVPGHGIGGEAGGAGETEEEAKDRVTEVVPTRRSALLLRSSLRSLSPLRRHSWGPGKNATGGGRGGDADMNQRSTLRSPGEGKPTFHRRSYSLEGLSGEQDAVKGPCSRGSQRGSMLNNEEERGGGSLVSLTEEQEDAGEHGNMEEQRSRRYRPLRHSCPPLSLPLTKSVSMLTISQKDIEAFGQQHRKRRISFSFNLSPILLTKAKSHSHVDSPSSDDEDSLSMRSLSSTTGSLDYSISEEEPGPLRTDFEGKSSTKVGRTFSYLKSKMSKKTKEKDKDTKDKKMVNGHLFTAVSSGQAAHCTHCNKAFNNKDAFHCTHCHSYVHKSCRESLPGCAKVKMKFTKHQLAVPDSSSIAATVTMRNKSSGTRERPWSAILLPDDHSSLAVASSRRHASMMAFHSSNLSKSISISNIAGPVLDEMPIKGLRYLSQSTDSLNRNSHVTESTESLTDEGTEMMDGQLMGEFEAEVKDLESDSWSLTVEQDLLKQLNTELIKRQDVIYELMQTEMHHVRTLRIMSEVYSKGLQKEVGLEPQTLDRLFPALDELLDLHSQHLHRLLERRRDNQEREDSPGGGFIVNRIGDVLLHQFSGSSAECMKRVYGKFCSRHNEAVNLYKELLTKDKRFQAFIKRKMSSSVVRRLGIPECILLVTQRITKYPGLILRMLQHTKESEDDYEDLNEAVRLVKEVITAVDDKVNEHEKRQRLKDIHARTDSKSIMRMRSGQMFAREDLLRGRRHIHDGPLQLKNTQGRLKDVHALLLSDVFVFLQEKDQKYVFASLDHRSTVLSLQKLIVREVANEERGLFLITVGSDRPEMVEVLASSRDERNTWIQLIQDAMHCIEKDDDEGIPSETEEDKRLLETKAKEMRDLLRQKDEQIVTLLEEKARVFREMCECGGDAAAAGGGVGGGGEGAEQRDGCCPAEPSLFRAVSGSQEALPRGEPIMKQALLEVETLQTLVNGSLGGAMAVGGQQDGGGGGVGPVCLPRRAETFGGFDSHQMNSKSGDRDESGDTAADLRRTESDSVLKKGGNANLLLLLKRNSEQVLHSVSHLHDLLSALQAVVVQQDSVIEDQRQVLVLSNSSTSNNSSSSSTAPSSRHSSRPNSLIEQEKQRSLEKHRQELASLQRQQSAHAEERRRREKEWEKRESELMDREVLLHVQEEDTGRRRVELEREREELHNKKEEYQRDLERLRDAQRKLERDRDTLQRERERVEQIRLSEGRTNETTPSSESEDSLHHHHHHPADRDLPELLLLGSSSPPRLQPSVPRKAQSLPRGKSLNPFTSSNSSSSHQMPGRLLQLASKNKDKDKDKKEKKKKKKKEGKGGTTDTLHLEGATLDGEIFFC